MAIQKITVFECDTCRRQIELELDDKRPYPSRCNITNKCPGLLTAKTTKRARSELFPPIVFGLEDYIQRGTAQDLTREAQPTALISLMAGISSMSLAALKVSTDGLNLINDVIINDVVTVDQSLFDNLTDTTSQSGELDYAESSRVTITLELFELDDSSIEFTEYYFVQNGITQQISGSDDSDARLLLRFSVDDTIRVIVNGIELVRDTDFTAEILNTGIHAITFTPLLTSSLNIIRTLVYTNPADITDPTSERIKTIQFSGRDLAAESRSNDCWGDALEVEINNEKRLVLTCESISSLTLNSRYQLRGAFAISPVNGNIQYELSPEKLFFLFGDNPYSFIDKSSDVVLNLKEAIDQRIQFQYIQDSLGNATLQTEITNLTDLAKRIITSKKASSTIINDADDETYHQNTNISSKYIIGHV